MLKKLLSFSFLLSTLGIGFLFFPSYVKAVGTTYYVANAGNDACSGTSSAIGASGVCAWKTVSRVNTQVLVPGDTVLFKRGDVWAEVLNPTENGTLANPIIFNAYGSGALPKITGGATAYSLFTSNNYQEFRNIQFTNANPTGIAVVLRGAHLTLSELVVNDSGGDGILLDEGASFITISSSTISNNGQNQTGDANNIGIGGSGNAAHDILIADNDIYGAYKNNVQTSFTDTGATPYNITFTRNKIHGSVTQAGLSFDAVASSVATYNIIYDNATYGLLVAPISYPPVEDVNVSFYNNTVVNNTLYGLYLNTTGGGTATVIFKNNIVAQNDTGGAGSEIGATGTGYTLTSDYNLVYHSAGGNFMMKDGGFGTWAQWKSVTGQDAHSLNANPLFSDINAKDFTLQSVSPAINSGTNLGSTYDQGSSPVSSWPGSVVTVSQGAFGAAFEMGAFVFPSYTIGGTVSGLTGTVVLQNNAGDNLSLSTNGSFTFSTSQNNASTYNVTVLTQPASQTCVVSNGSGTVSSGNITTVSVVCSNSTKAITSFNLNGLSPVVTGVVNEDAKTVTLTVLYGTSLTSLIPTIVHTGVSVSPGSGIAHTFVDGVSSTYTVTAANGSTQNYAVTVNVSAATAHTITASAGANGSISPSGSVLVNDGSSQVFTITAQSGYHIATVIADGFSTTATSPYTFSNVTTNHTLSVTFAQDVSVSSGGGSPIVGSYGTVTQNSTYLPLVATSSLADLQGRISALMAQLQSLVAQMNSMSSKVLDATPFIFSRNLSLYQTLTDVVYLQKFLNTHGFVVTQTGPGSPGNESNFFGLMTYKALVKFQKSVGVYASGYFGPTTRKYIQDNY